MKGNRTIHQQATKEQKEKQNTKRKHQCYLGLVVTDYFPGTPTILTNLMTKRKKEKEGAVGWIPHLQFLSEFCWGLSITRCVSRYNVLFSLRPFGPLREFWFSSGVEDLCHLLSWEIMLGVVLISSLLVLVTQKSVPPEYWESFSWTALMVVVNWPWPLGVVLLLPVVYLALWFHVTWNRMIIVGGCTFPTLVT